MFSSLSLVCFLLATTLVVDAGKIIVVGGEDNDKNDLNTVDVFDTETGGVSHLSPLPLKLESAAMVVSGGRILAIGGIVDSDNTNETLIYNSKLDTWVPYVQLPRHGGGTAVSINDTIYFSIPTVPLKFSSLFVLEKNATAWSRGPITLYDHFLTEGAAYNNSFYMCGGMLSLTPTSSDLCERYDVIAGKWLPVPHMLKPRLGCAMVALDNHVYAIGGQDPYFLNKTSNEKFNPTTGKWSLISAMQKPRMNHAVATDGRYIYVLGGYDGDNTMLDSIEKYDPKSDTWEFANSTLSDSRAMISAVYVDTL